MAEEHKTGITTEADQKVADVNYTKVDGVEKEVVPMYAHIANNNSDLSSFAAKMIYH